MHCIRQSTATSALRCCCCAVSAAAATSVKLRKLFCVLTATLADLQSCAATAALAWVNLALGAFLGCSLRFTWSEREMEKEREHAVRGWGCWQECLAAHA